MPFFNRPQFHRRAKTGLLPFALTLTFGSALHAASPPDAGALQQQIEREQVRPLPPQAERVVVEPSRPVSPRRGNGLQVRAFQFRGNTLIGGEQLAAALEPYRQRPLDFGEMEALTQVLADMYRAQGYLASVVLPAQDVSDGVVTFVVVEALVGKVVVAPRPDARTDPQWVRDRVAAQLPEGLSFDVQPLDRALLLANDLPGVGVTGALAAGAAVRQTDLVLAVVDKPLFSSDVTWDNAGGVSTGPSRLGLNAYGNGLLGRGDLWSLSASSNQGSIYTRVGLTVPVGYDGWRVGVNASRLRYHVVAADYVSQKLEGSTGVVGVEAVYPLVRAQRQNLYFNASLEDKAFVNTTAGTVASDYASRTLTWGLNGNRYDDFGGGGSTSASLSLTQGRLVLDNYATHATDATTLQTAGDYRKVRYGLSRQQVLTQKLSLLAAWSGQWTDRNLDSSEKFGLGGSTGVRAYPSGEGGGALGQLLSTELRWYWSDALALSAFYDTGNVTINARNDYPGASALNGYTLKGAGLGLAWQWNKSASFKLSWARRIGDNPNPAANGNDQDGTLVRDRVWASASLAF